MTPILTPNPKTTGKTVILPLIWLLVTLFLSTEKVLAAIDLISFTATPGEGSVILAWETATEFENAGFFIVRSLDQVGTYNRISPFILAKGDGVTGAAYEFIDEQAAAGQAYYYKLEAVGIDQLSTFYGPVVAYLPGLTHTPTASATATSTPTNTPTPTHTSTGTKTPSPSPSPTTTSFLPTSTANFTPFFTPLPFAATITVTPTFSTTVTLTSTATNIQGNPESLPILALPEEASDPWVTITPSPTPVTNQLGTPDDEQAPVQKVQAGNPFRTILILLIIVLWVISSAGIYLYIQKRESG